jgi:hypothetical protein
LKIDLSVENADLDGEVPRHAGDDYRRRFLAGSPPFPLDTPPVPSYSIVIVY